MKQSRPRMEMCTRQRTVRTKEQSLGNSIAGRVRLRGDEMENERSRGYNKIGRYRKEDRRVSSGANLWVNFGWVSTTALCAVVMCIGWWINHLMKKEPGDLYGRRKPKSTRSWRTRTNKRTGEICPGRGQYSCVSVVAVSRLVPQRSHSRSCGHPRRKQTLQVHTQCLSCVRERERTCTICCFCVVVLGRRSAFIQT